MGRKPEPGPGYLLRFVTTPSHGRWVGPSIPRRRIGILCPGGAGRGRGGEGGGRGEKGMNGGGEWEGMNGRG